MQSIKHFVCAGLVMTHDPCPLVDVTGRVWGLRFKEGTLVLMPWCKTCKGEGAHNW